MGRELREYHLAAGSAAVRPAGGVLANAPRPAHACAQSLSAHVCSRAGRVQMLSLPPQPDFPQLEAALGRCSVQLHGVV